MSTGWTAGLLGGTLLAVCVAACAVAWQRRRAAPLESGRDAPSPRQDAGAGDAPAHDAGVPLHGWWRELVEHAGVVPPDVHAGEAVLAATRARIAGFAAEPQRLPRRPQLLPQLLGALNDDDSSARDIAALIARDPALAASLLKMANSTLYRFQSLPVESVERAVARVGTQGLRQLVALALMQPVMRAGEGALARLPERVWEHTQHASMATAQVARALGREDVFAVQLLVMLQGLGAIVVLQSLRDSSERAGGAMPAADAIAALLQQQSPLIGALVAREWQLSSRMSQALQEQATTDPSAMGALARSLALAGPAGMVALLQARGAATH